MEEHQLFVANAHDGTSFGEEDSNGLQSEALSLPLVTVSKRSQFLEEGELIHVRRYEAHMKREYRKRCRTQCQQIPGTMSVNLEPNPVEGANIEDRNIEERKRQTIDNISQLITTELSHFGKEDRNYIMHEILNDSRVLQCTDDLLFQYTGLISALRNSLQVMKVSASNDQLFLKRYMLCTLVNGLMHVNQDRAREVSLLQVARLLNIHPRNLYDAQDRVENEAVSSNMTHLVNLCKRNPSSNGGLSHAMKERVVKFWTDHTRVSPNKKDVCRHRLGFKHYIEHPVHLLDETQA